MRSLPPAILVTDPPSVRPAPELTGRTPVELPLPDEPFDLGPRHLVCSIEVDDEPSAQAALLAAMRTVALVVRLELTGSARATFLDELGRVAEVSEHRGDEQLSREQLEVLRLLALGRSVAEAAQALGISRRTAYRRLADARELLGVETVTEAVVRCSASW